MGNKIDNDIKENNGVSINENNGKVNVSVGLSYSETRLLCKDLIKNELQLYRAEAAEEAEKREKAFTFKMLSIMEKEYKNPKLVHESFSQPSMQIDFIEAEKAYIKYGKEDLLNILTNILSERIKEKEYSLLQVTLSESIKVCPLLMQKHLSTLALRFLLVHTKRLKVFNFNQFKNYITQNILPIFESGVSKSDADYQHLNFTRCATTSAFSSDLIDNFIRIYKGIFSKGISVSGTESEILQELVKKYPKLFIPCINDVTKLQVNSLTDEVLEQQFIELNVDTEDRKIVKRIYDNEIMNKEEVTDFLNKNIPGWESFHKYWNENGISRLNLTSVGIILGAFYASQITGEKFNLSIWIS